MVVSKGNRVEVRTKVFDNSFVRGSEFLRRLKKVAKKNELAYKWNPVRGVGSHGTVYVGGRFAIVKDLKQDLGPGLLSDMCKQLGIRKDDL